MGRNRKNSEGGDSKRSPSRAHTGPEHIRTREGGVRTTETPLSVLDANNRLAQAEDFSDSEVRASKAGPDPYKLWSANKKDKDPAELSLQQAQVDSSKDDAEVSVPGSTLTDTGMKIELNPDRQAADDKTEPGPAGDPYEEATKKAGKNELTADKNPGALYGGV